MATLLFHGGLPIMDTPKGVRHKTALEFFFEEDKESGKQIDDYMAQIAGSRKRAQKTQREINRLKKKTATLIDQLG